MLRQSVNILCRRNRLLSCNGSVNRNTDRITNSISYLYMRCRITFCIHDSITFDMTISGDGNFQGLIDCDGTGLCKQSFTTQSNYHCIFTNNNIFVCGYSVSPRSLIATLNIYRTAIDGNTASTIQ